MTKPKKNADTQEKTRWVVEWWSGTLNQWHSCEGNELRADAERRLKNFTEHTPDARTRLVEVVERRTVRKSLEPSSPARPTMTADCNESGMAGLGAAHG